MHTYMVTPQYDTDCKCRVMQYMLESSATISEDMYTAIEQGTACSESPSCQCIMLE